MLLAIALATAACAGRPRIENALPTADELARAIMSAVADRDLTRLRSLALNEAEFRDVVWPSLPASRPERNLPFDYVWGDLNQKSQASLRGIIAEYGGRRFTLERVKFRGQPREYGEFRVHSDATFVVTNATGQEIDLRLCGSFIEAQGHWKAFSFAVDR